MFFVALPVHGPCSVDDVLCRKVEPRLMTASPVLIGTSLSQAAWSSPAPAAAKIAPHTPPPIFRSVLAASTIASTLSFVMSCRTMFKGIGQFYP